MGSARPIGLVNTSSCLGSSLCAVCSSLCFVLCALIVALCLLSLLYGPALTVGKIRFQGESTKSWKEKVWLWNLKLSMSNASFKIGVNNFHEHGPNLVYLIPLNLAIKISPRYSVILEWCIILPSIIMQKSETYHNQFLRKWSIPTFLRINKDFASISCHRFSDLFHRSQYTH